ncbi:MAG: fimbrial protein [Gammaproteobacteria bacterium]
MNGSSALELVYTGPYLPSNNSTLTGELSRWKVKICDDPKIGNFFGIPYYAGCNDPPALPRPVGIFNINATFRILVPTCDVDPGSVNKTVNLPGTDAARFSGPGSTAGKTPFSLQLTHCDSNLGVFVTLNTNHAQAGATGVIAPTSGAGNAAGVGVQLLEADGATPVTFGNPIHTGTTTASDYTINLYARYYQTGATAGAGDVKAVATYTIQYQ